MLGPLRRGNEEGDEPRLDSQLDKVFAGNRGVVWGWISLSVGRISDGLGYDALCELWIPSDMSIRGSAEGMGANGRRHLIEAVLSMI